MSDAEQLPPEPDMAGDAKTADARGSLSDAISAQVSASRDSASREFMGHDPATCWWCLNPQSETELAHKREMELKVA